MIWFTKHYPFGAEWAADQDRFSDLMMKVAARGTNDYMKMMMVAGPKSENPVPQIETIYISLPEPELAALFPGYERADGPPPSVASLLVGDQREFELLFQRAEVDSPPIIEAEPMCNLYSMTRNREAILRLFRVARNRAAAYEPQSAIFPGYQAPVVRKAADGERELVVLNWGFVLLQNDRAPKRVTNIRDDKAQTNSGGRPSRSGAVWCRRRPTASPRA